MECASGVRVVTEVSVECWWWFDKLESADRNVHAAPPSKRGSGRSLSPALFKVAAITAENMVEDAARGKEHLLLGG